MQHKYNPASARVDRVIFARVSSKAFYFAESSLLRPNQFMAKGPFALIVVAAIKAFICSAIVVGQNYAVSKEVHKSESERFLFSRFTL